MALEAYQGGLHETLESSWGTDKASKDKPV